MRAILAAFVAVTTLLVGTPADAAPRPSTGFVLDPATKPYGHTFGEWSARWWQYMFSIPADRNPLTDLTGRRCGVGQSGRVFFLGAELDHFGKVNRTCRLSSRDAIFFPIINCKNDNTAPVGSEPTPPLTYEKLLEGCQNAIKGVADLGAELDDKPIPGLKLGSPNHAAAPAFRVRVPDNNLLQVIEKADAPGGQTISPMAADGVYAMLRPLRRGKHKLHFHARQGTDVLDVTYTLRVR